MSTEFQIIKNEEETILHFSRKRFVLAAGISLMMANYTYAAVVGFDRLGASSSLWDLVSYGFNLVAVVVFAKWFLECTIVASRVSLQGSQVVLTKTWPFELFRTIVSASALKRITIVTLFNHLSTQANIVLTFHTAEGKRLGLSLPTRLAELNPVVEQIQRELEPMGVEILVTNEHESFQIDRLR